MTGNKTVEKSYIKLHRKFNLGRKIRLKKEEKKMPQTLDFSSINHSSSSAGCENSFRKRDD